MFSVLALMFGALVLFCGVWIRRAEEVRGNGRICRARNVVGASQTKKQHETKNVVEPIEQEQEQQQAER